MDAGKTLKAVLAKTVTALIAGGALAFNAWIAGIFNSGHPVGGFSVQFFLLILAQAAIVIYVIALSSVVAVEVAAGILGGTLIIIGVDLAGAFRGAFAVQQFVGQLFIAYSAVVAVILVPAIIKHRKPSATAPQKPL
jgi:hypothetical protein